MKSDDKNLVFGIVVGSMTVSGLVLIVFIAGGITFDEQTIDPTNNERKTGFGSVEENKDDGVYVKQKDKLFFLMLADSDCYGLLFQNSTGSRVCLLQDELFDVVKSLKENHTKTIDPTFTSGDEIYDFANQQQKISDDDYIIDWNTEELSDVFVVKEPPEPKTICWQGIPYVSYIDIYQIPMHLSLKDDVVELYGIQKAVNNTGVCR